MSAPTILSALKSRISGKEKVEPLAIKQFGRQRFTLAKSESVYWNFPLAKALSSADNTALGIPRSDISIDQRAESAILSTTCAASGRGLYASHAYKS